MWEGLAILGLAIWWGFSRRGLRSSKRQSEALREMERRVLRLEIEVMRRENEALRAQLERARWRCRDDDR